VNCAVEDEEEWCLLVTMTRPMSPSSTSLDPFLLLRLAAFALSHTVLPFPSSIPLEGHSIVSAAFGLFVHFVIAIVGYA
jgi:hypothetical protein